MTNINELTDSIMRGEKTVEPADLLIWQFEDIRDGRRQCWHFEYSEASGLTQAFLPGTNTLINGSPGHGKSLWLQQLILGLHFQNVPVAYLHMEYEYVTHLRRALAQIHDAARLLNEKWVKYNSTEAIQTADVLRDKVNSFGRCLTVWERRGTYKDVIEWTRKQARTGKKVIAIDPITKAARPRGVPIPDADEDLVDELSAIGKEFKCSLVMVIHPKSSPFRQATDFLSNMAGGAAFERFALTVFYLEMLKEPLTGASCLFGGHTYTNDEDSQINRILHICKANNGTGNGKMIGYKFDPQTLRYKEIGLIQKDKKGKWK